MTLDIFLDSWSRGVTAASTLWNGRLAYNDLKLKKALDEISFRGRLRNNWRMRDPFQKILDAADKYREQLDLAFAREVRAIEKFLEHESERIRKKGKFVQNSKIRSVLAHAAGDIEGNLTRLKMLSTKRPSPLGTWGKLVPIKRGGRMDQKADLDNKLQLEIAQMLSAVLEGYGVKRITIARLVCLAYWKLGLAKNEELGLIIVATKRLLTDRAVDNKLERMGLVVK